MYTAIWNNVEIARSSRTIEIEGNQYFPPGDVHQDLLKATDQTSRCPWKGLASYSSIEAGGAVNKNAAWVYKDPKDAAKEIKGYYAFWNGVTVRKE